MSNLYRRQGTILAANSSDSTRPDFAANYTVTVYEVGAVVNGAQTGVGTVTVRAGHGVVANDYIMVGTDTATFRLVASVTATTLVLDSGTLTVADKDVVVNLGPDTGTTAPNWDGSSISIYDEPSEVASAVSNSRVTCDSEGGYGYWTNAGDAWEVVRDGSGDPSEVITGAVRVRGFGAATTFADGDATPDVSASAELFKTANTSATTITGFDNATEGQRIVVVVGDALTTLDFTGTTLKGNGGRDYLANSGDIISAIYDGTNWNCTIEYAQTNRAETFVRPEQPSPPSGFDWNPPCNIWKDQHGRFNAELDIEAKAPQGAGVAYYVDPVNGSDAAAGTTRGTALQSIATALGKADIDIMYLVPGLFLRNRTWGATTIARNLSVYVLDGGRAILSRAMNGLSWSNHSGDAWKATTSAVEAVYDATNRDANGDYLVLTEESSVANVVSNPGTWILDGGELYVHTTDGREPDSDVDLRVFRTDNYAGNFLADKILYCENVSFEGGNTACFRIRNDSASGVCKGYFKNCSFKYGTRNSNGLEGQGMTELFLVDCISAVNVADGFNYDLLNGVESKIIELRCIGRSNGTASDTNVNGSSAHDDSRIVRIAGAYHNNGGPNVADVSTVQSWNLGCAGFESMGATDITNYNFGCATNAEMWLDGCASWGSTYDYAESNSSVLKVRRCTDGRLTAAGDIGSY